MATSDYDLAEIKNGNGNVHTHDVREQDLGLDAPPKSNISLTQIDAGDMYRLGKKQELNVCGTVMSQCARKLTGQAQLPLHLHHGLRRGPDGNVGRSIEVYWSAHPKDTLILDQCQHVWID